ncbi:dynein regulatory complex subunit 2 [Anarrhichthys ocellatus]|uniref:dynein regulatory complex subunit 2 n=1 Tax=Anarrhichthys ocellatus TaxID=433405 RepID=UPI0012EE3F38|nr:dynein regulatory complex subunit 2 [Anarrhichthys ocellatus]
METEHKTNAADRCSLKETQSSPAQSSPAYGDVTSADSHLQLSTEKRGAMAPKKGGGKTEEERLMLQQQRAQAEEEKAMKEEESLTLFLEDKLQKEERNTEVNLLKLNEGWRSILRQSRAGELRGNVEVLSQTFERQRDVLDNVVKTLQHDLQGAELQWAQVRRVHMHQVERLCARQHQRVTLVQQQWETVLQQLSSRFISERERVSSHSLQCRGDVGDTSFSLEQQHRAAMEEIYQLYLNSINNQNSDDKDFRQICDTEEQKLKDLDREVKKVKKTKELKTEEQKLKDLLVEQQQLIHMNDKEVKKVKKMKQLVANMLATSTDVLFCLHVTNQTKETTLLSQETVVHLRDKLNKRETENQSVEQDLKDERKAAIMRNCSLQDQLTRGRAVARKRLTELTVQSDAAARKLKAAIAKGPKVLRVAEMCRKLERQLKDVLLVVPQEDERQETTGPETDGPDKEMSALQQLMGKINTSVLQTEALRKRTDDLNRDNRQLRLLLRQRQDGMTVGDQDVGGRHALLTVHLAPTTAAPPHADRRYNVIEGVHAAKHAL